MSNAAVVPPIGQYYPSQVNIPGTGQGPPYPGTNPRINVSAVDNSLTLENGMTAGYGVKDGHNDNWPVNNGIWNQYGDYTAFGQSWAPIRIGFLRNIPGSGFAGYTLYFMYNPNEVAVGFQTNPQSYAPLYTFTGGPNLTAAGVPTVPALAQAQTVSWALYFDRTYDMYVGASKGANPADDRGVLKDVAALYNLMGTFLSNAATPMSTPCEVVFGQNGAGQLWGFTGYITGFTITYGIFRHDMIPSRCEIQLTMMAIYVGTAAPGGGTPGSAGTAAQNAATAIQNPLGSAQTTSSAYGPPAGSAAAAANAARVAAGTG